MATVANAKTKPKGRAKVDPLAFLLDDIEERSRYLRRIGEVSEMHWDEKAMLDFELDGLDIDIKSLRKLMCVEVAEILEE